MEVLVKYGFKFASSPIIISVEKDFDNLGHIKYFMNSIEILKKGGIIVI